MQRILYLDDIRNPPEFVNADYTVVRSFKEACDVVSKESKFDLWDLDHDLGVEKDRDGLWRAAPTGMDFLKWASHNALDKWPKNFVSVHSANPVGRENMESLIRNVEKHLLSAG